MAWYYVVNGASVGPIGAGEIESLRQQNVISSDTPVWTNGMAEWLPLERSPLGAGAPGGVLAPAAHTCAECGRVLPESDMLHYENAWVCAACKPVFFQRLREGVAAPGELPYASVGRRFVALMLDGFILVFAVFAPLIILSILLSSGARAAGGVGMPPWFMPLYFIVIYGAPAAYEIFFVGKYGATPGKMIMKVRVVTPEGGPIGYGRSTGRYFAKLLSGIILYIGYLMAFWDDEKRALHDRICQTRVIKLPEA
jgi:uncharacterized RDD family membrane protein YckC